MNTCVRKRNWQTLLPLLMGMAVIAGCISFDSKDMQWAMGQTILLPATATMKISSASSIYRSCTGRLPASLEELRSTNCADAEKQHEISNLLAEIPWDSITNVVLGATPDGKQTMTLGFAPKFASTNGTGFGWNGGVFATTVEITDGGATKMTLQQLDDRRSAVPPAH